MAGVVYANGGGLYERFFLLSMVACVLASPFGYLAAWEWLSARRDRRWAAGGRATVENIQLRCRAHNDYESEVYFGPMRSDPGSARAREAAASVARAAAAVERVMDDTFSFRNEREAARTRGS